MRFPGQGAPLHLSAFWLIGRFDNFRHDCHRGFCRVESIFEVQNLQILSLRLGSINRQIGDAQ